MFGYIYKTTNLINGKQYIGKHQYEGPGIDPTYYRSGVNLLKAIKKYGLKNFKSEIIEICENLTQLNEREQYWIEIFHASNNKDFYNIAQGGDGGAILNSLSPEQKQAAYDKRQQTWMKNQTWEQMGTIRSQYYIEHPETKQQISNTLKKYYKEHPEAVQIMSERQKGKKWTDSQREHRMASMPRGKKHPASKSCICIETQEVFVSSVEAAEHYGGSYKVIWKCCRGQCETAAGFHWAFVQDLQKQAQLSQFIGQPRKIFRNSKFGYKKHL